MTLEVIYVTRHGFRSPWSVDPATGVYTASIRSPTGLPTDPALTSYGVDQARELAVHLAGVDPPIEQVYSSPYYRCLQTVQPFVSQRNSTCMQARSAQGKSDSKANPFRIRAEAGLGEFYGVANFEHPPSAPLSELTAHFPGLLDASYVSALRPPRHGETLQQLHDRAAAVVEAIIERSDREGHRTILVSTHAAVVIALGRVLTGRMPASVDEEDFGAYTCGLSMYRRRRVASSSTSENQQQQQGGGVVVVPPPPSVGDSTKTLTGVPEHRHHPGPSSSSSSSTPWPHLPHHDDENSGGGHRHAPRSKTAQNLTRPREALSGTGSAGSVDHPHARGLGLRRSSRPGWWRGMGVCGGWTCEANSCTTFLRGGSERGWKFAGDESFVGIDSPQEQEAAVAAAVAAAEAADAASQLHEHGHGRRPSPDRADGDASGSSSGRRRRRLKSGDDGDDDDDDSNRNDISSSKL